MGYDQKNTSSSQDRKDHRSSNFKAFVESTAAAGNPDRQRQKPTAENKYMDQQNKLTDQHNLRK